MKLKTFLLLFLILGSMGIELSFFLFNTANKVYILAAVTINEQCKSSEDCVDAK